MNKSLLILTAALSFFIIGCATTGGTSKSTSNDITPSHVCGEWKIQSLTGFKNIEQTEASLSILANEDEKFNLNGYSGVNSFFTTLEDSPKAFPIGDNMGSTKMMGAPEDMAFEDELLKVLCNAKSWKVEGRKLIITSGKTTAVFVK